jgi:putative colanic acid biosynthesis acetyltransferase WcaF
MGWPLRKVILQLYGAKIGRSWLHNRVKIWAPSRLEIGDHTYIDAGVYLYNPWRIKIGDRVIISFNSLICTPSHDFRQANLPLIGKPISIESDIWVAANCIVGPGVILSEGTVVGAGTILFKNTEKWSVYTGNPAEKVAERTILEIRNHASNTEGGAEDLRA